MAKNKKADNQVSAVRRAKHGWVLTVFFSILAVACGCTRFSSCAMNSLKKKGLHQPRYPFCTAQGSPFLLSELENLCQGSAEDRTFLQADGLYSVIITVGSVAVIILCTSMCAWYIYEST